MLDVLLMSNRDLREDLTSDEPFSNSDLMRLNFDIKVFTLLCREMFIFSVK